MADLSKTVEIIFGAVDNTGPGLAKLNSSINSFAGNASKLTGPLADLAKGAELTGAALGALGVALVAHSTSAFQDFQSSVIGLQKVLGDTDPPIQKFRDTARDLALQYGITSNVVLDGIANFKQAGFTAAEAAKLQENALQLMIVGDVDAARASDILVRSIKGFGFEVSQTPRFIEALNNVSNDYATDVNQLADGMSRIAPIAKIMGFSFEESAGLLTPIIEIFGSGSEAADGLKTGLLKLIDNSKATTDALASIGVAQTDTNGKLRSGKDIFYDVAKAFQTMDDNQKLFLTQQLVGIEQSPRMVKVFDNLAKVQEVTAAAMENTGSVVKELHIRLESLKVLAGQNASQWNELSLTLGEKLATGTIASTKGMISLGNALENAVKSGGFDPILNQIIAMNTGFGQFLEQVAKNLPAALAQVDFSGLVKAFKDLGLEFGGIFDGLDLSTPQGLAKAIQLVVDSVASLVNMSQGIVAAWSPVVRGFLTGVDAFNNLDDSTKKYIGTALGLSQVFETLKGAVTSGAGALGVIGAALTKISESNAEVALVKMVGSLSSPTITAAAAAFAAIAFAVKSNASAYDDLKARQETVATSTEHLAESQGKIKARLDEISQRTGVTVGSMAELNKAVDNNLLVFNNISGAYEKAGAGVRDYDAEVAAAAKSGFDFQKAANSVAGALGLVGKAAGETTREFKTHDEAMSALLATDSKLVDQYITEEKGLYTLHQSQKAVVQSSKELAVSADQLAEQTGKLTERQKLAIEQTGKLELQLNELASNERIKHMEFSASIKIADIQAQAQQVVAAFNEIGVAIQATQQAQAAIFGSLTGALGDRGIKWIDKDFLKDLAKEQQQQAQQALDDQSRLIDAQVNQLNARTNALVNGQALINVNADNLAPELQTVLRSLLEHIQIEANAEGLEILL